MENRLNLFPDEKDIFPVWRWFWPAFYWTCMMVILVSSSKGTLNQGAITQFKLAGTELFGMLLLVTIFILFFVSMWDVALYIRKVRRPIKRIYRGLIVEERVDILKHVRSSVSLIILYGVIILLLTAVLLFLWLNRKISGWEDAVTKKIPVVGDHLKDHFKWVSIGICGVLVLLGIFSWTSKINLSANWKEAMDIYPHRHLSAFMNGKPGLSDAWLIQISLLFFLLPAFIFLACAGNFFGQGKIPSAFSFLSKPSSDMKTENTFWRAIMAGLGAIFVVIVLNAIAYMEKGRRVLDFTLKNSLIRERDAFELARVRKALNATSSIQLFVFLLWFTALASAILLNESWFPQIASNQIGQKVLRIALLASCGLMASAVVMIYLAQDEVKKSFKKCHCADCDKGVLLLKSNVSFRE